MLMAPAEARMEARSKARRCVDDRSRRASSRGSSKPEVLFEERVCGGSCRPARSNSVLRLSAVPVDPGLCWPAAAPSPWSRTPGAAGADGAERRPPLIVLLSRGWSAQLREWGMYFIPAVLTVGNVTLASSRTSTVSRQMH